MFIKMFNWINVCVTILALKGVWSHEDVIKSPTECHCAAFEVGVNPLTAKPILVKDPEIPMNADPEGRQECAELCVALAAAAKDEAPKILCDIMKKDVDNLRVGVFYKICGESWQYTGKSNSVPICCRNNKSVTCA